MSELRYVKNTGTTIWVDSYGGQQYQAAPGQQILVPKEAVDLWMGNNDLRDDVNRKRNHRQDEYRRLRGRYGFLVGMSDPDNDGRWPTLEVTTVDGEPCETVISDPEGAKVHLAEQTVDEQTKMRSLIEQQQRDLAELRSQYKSLLREKEAEAHSDMEVDEPQSPPSRKARSRGVKVEEIPLDA